MMATINAARQHPRNDGSVGPGPISTLTAADAQCSKFSRGKEEENERVGLAQGGGGGGVRDGGRIKSF